MKGFPIWVLVYLVALVSLRPLPVRAHGDCTAAEVDVLFYLVNLDCYDPSLSDHIELIKDLVEHTTLDEGSDVQLGVYKIHGMTTYVETISNFPADNNDEALSDLDDAIDDSAEGCDDGGEIVFWPIGQAGPDRRKRQAGPIKGPVVADDLKYGDTDADRIKGPVVADDLKYGDADADRKRVRRKRGGGPCGDRRKRQAGPVRRKRDTGMMGESSVFESEPDYLSLSDAIKHGVDILGSSSNTRQDRPKYIVLGLSSSFDITEALEAAQAAQKMGLNIVVIEEDSICDWFTSEAASSLATHPLLYMTMENPNVQTTMEKMVCQTAPEIIKFEVNSTDDTIQVNPDVPVQLICQGYGNPALTLSVTGVHTKREVISQLPVSDAFAQGVDVSVTFKAGQSDEFVCTGSNSLGSVQQSLVVLVDGPPELYAAPEQERRVSVSGVITFTFKVICQPECTYSVKRVASSGTVEVASTHEQIEYNPHYRTIRLTVTSPPDPLTPNHLAHEFTVTAVNAEGSLDISFMGFYYGPPELYDTTDLENPVLTVDSTVTFAVDIVSQSAQVTSLVHTPDTDTREAVGLFSQDFQQLENEHYGTLTVVFTSPSSNLLSHFILTVDNGAGVLEIPFTVIRTDVPPEIEVFTGNSEAGLITLATGDSFSLSCQAAGYAPILHISDRSSNVIAVQGSPTSQTGSRLEWSGRVDSRWSGIFTCHASNQAGSVSSTVTLLVNGPPEMYQESDAVERMLVASPDTRVSSCWNVIFTPAPIPTSGFVLKYFNKDRSLHNVMTLNTGSDTATFDPVNDLYGMVCLDFALPVSDRRVSYFILTLTNSAGHLDIPFIAFNDNIPQQNTLSSPDNSDNSDNSDLSDPEVGLIVGLCLVFVAFLVALVVAICVIQSQISSLKKATQTKGPSLQHDKMYPTRFPSTRHFGSVMPQSPY